MAINTLKATIQMRSGNEEDFDPDQMTAGEWAVSKDTKYVRMCFKPGLTLRMATYEAFEKDMEEIRNILIVCKDIQAAVERFEQLAEQHKDSAALSAQAAKASETNAKTSEANAKDSETKSKISEVNSKDSEVKAKASEAASKDSEEKAKASETNSKESEANSKKSEEAAAGSAGEASNYSDLSRSYAVGTGNIVRPGDSEDNAREYARQAKKSAELAQQTVDLNLPMFEVDTDTMYLIGTFDKIFNFSLTDDGYLTLEIGGSA